MAFADALAAATKAAGCNWLNNGGNAALTSAIVGGAMVPGGQVPALGAGLGLLALNYGCAYNPSGNGSPLPAMKPGACTSVSSGSLDLGILSPSGSFAAFKTGVKSVTSITYRDNGNCAQKPCSRYDYTVVLTTGSTATAAIVKFDDEQFTTRLATGAVCSSTNGGGITGTLPATEYTDASTNCTYVVEHLAWDVADDGSVSPVVKISSKTPATMASGGVISGCNFNPVVYRGPGGGGGGGGGFYFPWAPGPDVDGEPWWVPLLRGAAGGAAGAVVSKLLDEIFKEKTAADVYRLVSVCELDENDQPISKAREVQLAEAPILQGIVKRLDAMEVLMQGLKDFKQPVCEKKRPWGGLVSVRFVSLENSAGGERPLRKLLRYRDQAGMDQCAHANHWEGFEWEAGPVCVISKNLSWGTPQVWARDAAEGRRVIRHAAAIAGVNLLDPKHRWVTSSSVDPRYGRSGRMVVQRKALNSISVTKRDGPSGLPEYPIAG